MRLLPDHWLKLCSPGCLFMDAEFAETQCLDCSVEWLKKVIFARLSPDVLEAAIAERLGYNVEFSSALLGDFGIDNGIDGGIDIIRWLGVEANLDGGKILAAVDGVGASRVLGSFCARFRWGSGMM
jgi:hypothetical protein